jgi:hypothetical protein
MRTYLADIIPKIQRFSKKLDDLTRLTDQHWVSLDDIANAKRVFIFRPNNQLLISENGIVEKGSWDYLGNQSLLIENKNESLLLKHGFFDENVIALKLDSTDRYAFFINETKYHEDLNTIEDVIKFLKRKYSSADDASETLLDENFNYDTLGEKESYNWTWGSHTIYKIKYFDGTTGELYRGRTSKRFFYENLEYGIRYFDTFKETAIALYRYLKNR